ncbi:hypothetical protein B0H21DRAFT_701129 [Amylocystis lapponica]|nr:hypothetical protein B0H21DRAFT_701129 [Amylocystis lapponica]
MHVSSILCALPATVLDNIALELALLDAIGPPSQLLPLLLSCRHVYHTLSFQNCPALYARIFRCKFDHRAARRRIGPRATYSSNLAKQLKVYSLALCRIRRADISSDFLLDDLWTAFIMCTENDGKNEAQLHWAGLNPLLDNFIRTRLWEDREDSDGWPEESTVNSLAIWLLWFTTDYDKLAAQSPEQRSELMHLIRPYVLTALRYPSFHAPDNHFEFPLDRALQDAFPSALVTPHGFYPLYRQPEQLIERFRHYNRPLKISAPLIAQGAKLLYMTLAEVTPLPVPPSLPLNREHALQLGRTFVGPTQADLIHANAHKSVKLHEPAEWDWRSRLSPADGALEDDGVSRKGLRGKSALWDHDWQRLTCCADPWHVPARKGAVYTHGALAGLWQGRILVHGATQYFSLVTSVDFPAGLADQNPRLVTVPVAMLLREHHCISPARPVRAGGPGPAAHDALRTDDGVRNAWFPAVGIREAGGRVRIEERAGGAVACYETFVEGRASSHSADTCRMCADAEARAPAPRRRESAGTAADARAVRMQVDAALGPETDLDDLLDDIMSPAQSDSDTDTDTDDGAGSDADGAHACDGVQDIIVTGDTPAAHAQAWHSFRFYGRVRAWDGLVAIVRTPVHAAALGTYIFRGYVVAGRNLVGSWRVWTSNASAIPLEGPFVMSKV